MHIPSAPTQELELLPFARALELSGRRGDYDPAAWIYVPDFYTEYRYILGTRGQRPLICIGVNPSTAAPDDLDNTLKSVERIARGNGYDSFIMFNVYAQRATRPQDMDTARNEELHRENLAAFRYVLEASLPRRPAVWAAWGSVIEQRPYLPRCVEDMIAVGEEYGAEWFTAGPRSKKGHPHHPLYLRRDSVLEPFEDLRSYCAGL
ncbi:MAG: DUF1643 domain-containing protein [Oscillospiraceae bacterium]|nr:DUF1643 domain-containing protein [Oscillospiraceae bacterium]